MSPPFQSLEAGSEMALPLLSNWVGKLGRMDNPITEEEVRMRKGARTDVMHFVLIAFIFLSFTPVLAANIYVSPTGTGSGTKTSPTNLQNALDMARTNGQDDVIYLRQGTYSTGSGPFSYGSSGNDSKSVSLLGGWNTGFTARSSDPSLTLLDGGGVTRVLEVIADVAGVSIDFSVEGLTIQNGYGSDADGAGIRAYSGTSGNNGTLLLTIRNCVIQDNQATVSPGRSGGGMYADCYFDVYDTSFLSNRAYNGGALFITYAANLGNSLEPIIDNCIFADNSNIGGWQGSTIFNNVSPIIRNCSFTGRSDGVSSSGSGSTIYSQYSPSTRVYNTFFSKCVIDYWGSAIQYWDAGGEIKNCFFSNNRAGVLSGYGAVAYLNYTGPAETINITNCTFTGNQSESGFAGALHSRGADLSITNSIFWDNGSAGLYSEYGNATIRYSDIEGGLGGIGFADGGNNITGDPQFVTAGNYHLTAGSPCIDAGDNTASGLPVTDLDGDYRILDGGIGSIVDIGADEYSPTFSAVTLLTPNKGGVIPSGSDQVIGWGAPSQADWFKLLYSTDNGLTWLTIEKRMTDKGYLWHVPAMPNNKKTCRIKVVAYNDLNVKVGSDVTDLPFTIEVVKVTSPNGGVPLTSGDTLVEWYTNETVRPVATVQLFYTIDGGLTWRQMTGSPVSGNPGSFTWTVPSVTKKKCKVKVVLKDDKRKGVGSDISDAFFSILP
jgi:hypothetical protein